MTMSPHHRRHMTMTRSFSVLQLSATSRAGLHPHTIYKPSNFQPPAEMGRSETSRMWGKGQNMQKKKVVFHKRGFNFHSCHAAEPLTLLYSPGGKRGLVLAPLKPREGNTKLHLLYRGFFQTTWMQTALRGGRTFASESSTQTWVSTGGIAKC